MHAVGYIWGQDLTPIRAPLLASPSYARADVPVGFDVIILADLLFNRSEHDSLLWTCRECLSPDGVVLVAFGHHDPQKADLVRESVFHHTFFSRPTETLKSLVLHADQANHLLAIHVQDLNFFRKAVEAPYFFIVEQKGQRQMKVCVSYL